jgi:hypothetical protein
MMFLMPMPPTISEIVARAEQQRHQPRGLGTRATTSAMLRTLKRRRRPAGSCAVGAVGPPLPLHVVTSRRARRRAISRTAPRSSGGAHQAPTCGCQRHQHESSGLAETALPFDLSVPATVNARADAHALAHRILVMNNSRRTVTPGSPTCRHCRSRWHQALAGAIVQPLM